MTSLSSLSSGFARALPLLLLAGSCGDVVVANQELDGGDEIDQADAPQSDVSSYDAPSIQLILDLPNPAFAYEPELPAHFQGADVSALDNTQDNPISDTGATLGRVLFYDTMLSNNQTVACASCHDQARGFADTTPLSEGFAGGATARNSMSLFNLRYYQSGKMFWDERAESVEHQVLLPIQDSVEMGMALQDVVSRLENTEHYPILFALAFGDSEISSERVSLALGQFVRSIVSTESRYDVAIAAAGTPMGPFGSFSQQENLGKDLFFGPVAVGGAGCAACHMAPPPNVAILQSSRARNNGLLAVGASDRGVGAITNNAQDNGLFKIPSLRNIARTAPYMHDGSLATLRDVVDHYDSGIQDQPTLDPLLKSADGSPLRLELTEEASNALVAFLQTLTDESILVEERFSSPFR